MDHATINQGTRPNREFPNSPLIPNSAGRRCDHSNAIPSHTPSTGGSSQQNMEDQKTAPQVRAVYEETQSAQHDNTHQIHSSNATHSAHGMNTATLQSTSSTPGMSGVSVSKQNDQHFSYACAAAPRSVQEDGKNGRMISNSGSLAVASGLPPDDVPLESSGENKIPEQFEQWELPRRIKDWTNKEYAFFAEFCNKATSLNEVKKKLHDIRTEKVAQLVLTASSMGYPVNQSKIAEWFSGGAVMRGRSPLVKVCGAPGEEYIRISHASVERFGFNLEKGQEYGVSVNESDGPVSIVLTLIQ